MLRVPADLYEWCAVLALIGVMVMVLAHVQLRLKLASHDELIRRQLGDCSETIDVLNKWAQLVYGHALVEHGEGGSEIYLPLPGEQNGKEARKPKAANGGSVK